MKMLGTFGVGGCEIFHQVHIAGGLGIPNVGVLAQNSTQVATRFGTSVPEQMVGEFEGNVLRSVALHPARDIVIGVA